LFGTVSFCALGFIASNLPRLYAQTLLGLSKAASGQIAELQLEHTIPLGDVRGRIDHMTADLARGRVFVAELEEGSVAVIDLALGKVVKRLGGFDEPQGVAYAPTQDRLFVANGGDGRVQVYDGGGFAPVGEIALGEDADNVRADPKGRILVGYGSGAIAVIDPATLKRLADWRLAAHPEAFQIASDGQRIFVNEPNALRIGVIGTETGQEVGRWGIAGATANFPLALDEAEQKLFVAYRMPALLAAFNTSTGDLLVRVETCRDADDVFVDHRRHRIYVTCGEGAIAVLDEGNLAELGRLRTRSGARTGLYVAELDRLLVAVPAHSGEQAELRVYRPR